MNELINLIEGMTGTHLPVKALATLLPVLLPIAADLLDGDARLSPENRLKIQETLDSVLPGGL